MDGSRAAPLFTLAACPNDQHAIVASVARDLIDGGRGTLSRAFGAESLDRLPTEHPQHISVRKAPAQKRLIANARHRGDVSSAMVTGRGDPIRAEVCIEAPEPAENVVAFG